ncbi:hypothetical protein KC363_g7231 [Hortaea werneckii]|uniref:Mid2 domain-containing protein n=1 Tax=Hortaea werneckii TaxID=91943 RepID=A0A3M7EXK8_HORWE|nr:hypothetical protein KC361_g4521 [Hortaea werneckii]KAI6884888.1 hypothetical protein KC325_g3948 [Hortaea werneckii]KAI6994497.1 hypothetical protein KC359_g4573 [Hortaea werneckii]KAI7146368.1 hypothetical protein KC344_g3672 [Hortaea werneckii]KAI7175018.1 hypothetical protein KC360_g3923 [Hortaea werneckii]
MLALFSFGFATIKAEKIPDGIMPQKRQVAGTGVSTSNTPETTSATSQTTDDPSTSETTATSDTPTTTTPTDASSDTPASTTATPTSEQTSPSTTQPSPSTTTAAPSSTEDSSTAAPTTTSEDSSTDATTTPTSTPQSTSDPSSTDNTSEPSSTDNSSDASTTDNASTPSSTDSPSSTDNPSSAQSSTTESADSTQTSDASSRTSAASSRGSSQQSSTMMPTTIDVTTTNSAGSTYTSRLTTSTLVAAAAANERSSRTSSAPVSTGTGKSSNIVVIGTSTLNRSTLKHATTITSALVAEQTLPQTYTSYWTSDGAAYSSVITTGGVVTSTTGFATATVEPSLRNGGGDGTNLSTSSKKILGGVLGGVGGAILIGGIAFVCWRLWGKKHHPEPLPQEDEMLDSRDDSISREKMGRMGGSNGLPLDLGGRGSEGDAMEEEDRGYRNPNGGVNAASNF